MGFISVYASLLVLIFAISTTGCCSLLLPNSNAVKMEMAFASPIPRNDINLSTGIFESSLIFPPTDCKIRFASPTALSSRFPDPINIAMSSALLKADFPLASSFSLGRSSNAQDFIVNFFIAQFFQRYQFILFTILGKLNFSS